MVKTLESILENKRLEVAALKQSPEAANLPIRAADQPPPRGFADALKAASKSGYGLIAEIKKASPSKGLIRADFNPAILAAAYQAGGATCLSVLTDRLYFQGSLDDMVVSRAAVDLPVLRKDFMIDPLQVTEARAYGSDAILIIMAAVRDNLARELEDAAMALGMDVLIEIHDREELERAKALHSPLLGVNSRNLKTMETRLDVAEDLLAHFPDNRVAVAESGLSSPADLTRMAKHGAKCFLIGEALMREADVGAATKAILSKQV